RPGDVPCEGFEAILTRAPDRTCVKFSAPYRQKPQDLRLVARRLIRHFGPERCLWGSDWPWTQHEGAHDYAEAMDWLEDWTDADQRAAMAGAGPLIGFGAPAVTAS
ncbi:MAG: amidohydrolase family protein, partial [Pseudomonadota bacterium]